MRCFIWNWAGVLALLLLPLGGCSDTTTDGTGGAAGDGGEGGAAGTGGEAGSGGVVGSPTGAWSGSGQGGADGSFTVCFNVRDDGDALVRPTAPAMDCDGNSLSVQFDDCEGGFSTTEIVPIVDGSFALLNEQGGLAGFWDISGMIDGDTASGEATVGAVEGTCSGSWTASPAP